MKVWRKINMLLAFLTIAAAAQAQYGGFGAAWSPFHAPSTSYQIDSAGQLTYVPGKTNYSLSMGGIYGSSYGGPGYFTSYVTPMVSHNISKKFKLSGGVTISNTYGDFPVYSEIGMSMKSGHLSRANVFVQGQYLLSNKLTLTGTAYKDFDIYNPVTDPRYKDNGSQGVMLDLNFRPSEKFQINASFQYHKGRSPYHHNPFQGSSPFYSPGIGW